MQYFQNKTKFIYKRHLNDNSVSILINFDLVQFYHRFRRLNFFLI